MSNNYVPFEEDHSGFKVEGHVILREAAGRFVVGVDAMQITLYCDNGEGLLRFNHFADPEFLTEVKRLEGSTLFISGVYNTAYRNYKLMDFNVDSEVTVPNKKDSISSSDCDESVAKLIETIASPSALHIINSAQLLFGSKHNDVKAIAAAFVKSTEEMIGSGNKNLFIEATRPPYFMQTFKKNLKGLVNQDSIVDLALLGAGYKVYEKNAYEDLISYLQDTVVTVLHYRVAAVRKEV